MSRTHRFLPLLSVCVVVLAACQDDTVLPTEPAPAPALEATAEPATLRQTGDRPLEQVFHRISQSIGGFGGYFYDEEGNMVAYLVDPAEEGRARELLEPIVRSRTLGARERSSGRILFRQADYGFLELSTLRDRVNDPVLDTDGVVYTDLDEARNRFVVGVSTDAARQNVARVLREHAVPERAVLFEQAGRVVDLVTLRDYRRPVEGGLQIQRLGGGTCTFGFNAYWSGYGSFLTNSHCTSSFWSTDGSLMYQNNTSSAAKLVGYEIYDPAPKSCGIFGLYKCRWSDAAVIRRYASVSSNHGKIARTTSWSTGAGNSGSITINPNNPRMTITGEYAFPTGGEMFDKMGRTTGWTYGFVSKTCVDVNKSGGRRVLCQDWLHKIHADFGDSGSPVFRWHGNTVTLAGILWGGITQGGTKYILISAMWNIEKDLGALTTF